MAAKAQLELQSPWSETAVTLRAKRQSMDLAALLVVLKDSVTAGGLLMGELSLALNSAGDQSENLLCPATWLAPLALTSLMYWSTSKYLLSLRANYFSSVNSLPNLATWLR